MVRTELVLLLLLWSSGTVWAEHTPSLQWMRGYTNENFVGCCAEYDCIEATAVLLALDKEFATVQIGEWTVILPAARVHHSQNAYGYWCFSVDEHARTYIDVDGNRRATPPERPTRENTRCVFVLSVG